MRSERMFGKKTGSLMRLNLFLTSIVLLLTVGLLSGITARTKTVHLKVGSSICSFYQMSRMCREKYAVKHDDRLDCLAQGVKYFTDALSISAQEQINLRKREEWNDILEQFLDDPQGSANHLVLGLDVNQRQQARLKTSNKEAPNWV